jgi:hypothetical protein
MMVLVLGPPSFSKGALSIVSGVTTPRGSNKRGSSFLNLLIVIYVRIV